MSNSEVTHFSPHLPVLLTETLNYLQIQSDGIYVDCTFGRGGHSRAILNHLGPQGRLLAFDQDPEAIPIAQALAAADSRFQFVHSSFTDLFVCLKEHHWLKSVNGILLDLGISSPQLDNAERGFSFLREGPLDMRMNPTQGESLSDWLANATTSQLATVLQKYGEERYAKRIARAIIQTQDQQGFTSTRQLAEVIAAAHPAWPPDKHPATRSFLALRIFINRELEQLQQVLPQAVAALAPAGRLVVISFHSLEDRIVKRFIRDAVKGDSFPTTVPIPLSALRPTLRTLTKPIFPSAEEIDRNPRARSAVLRVAEKL